MYSDFSTRIKKKLMISEKTKILKACYKARLSVKLRNKIESSI